MDTIIIKSLQVHANHGVFASEKELGQRFVVNVKISTEFQNAGLTDTLDNTIHYGILAQEITEFLTKNTYDLIESAAEHTVLMLFNKYQNITIIELEIQKPFAPIMLPLEHVGVKIKRQKSRVYIALGGNIGDSNQYFDQAEEMLNNVKGILSQHPAKRITTKPYGNVKQSDFLNTVTEIITILQPKELLRELQKIEKDLKRERIIKWGPRTIDLDIIFYENQIINQKDLIIPHPLMQDRNFVIDPMVELNPYFIHPRLQKTMIELWEQNNDFND